MAHNDSWSATELCQNMLYNVIEMAGGGTNEMSLNCLSH